MNILPKDTESILVRLTPLTSKEELYMTELMAENNSSHIVKDRIGVVLEGGGGRGAYHIGVWKALEEAGLKKYVSAISGTSVGGLNAALFVQGDYDKAEEVWQGISVTNILSKKLSKKKIIRTIDELDEKGFKLYVREGLLEIINDALDLSIFDDDSSIPCYVTCVRTKKIKDGKDVFIKHKHDIQEVECYRPPKSYSKDKTDYFNMQEFNYQDRKRILLATSAIPFIFPQEKIGDYYYIDGGVKDNLPVKPLIEKEKCNKIVVVHLSREPKIKEIEEENYKGTNIYHIRPRDNQGGFIKGTLNFSPKDAIRRIDQGYEDTKELFANISEDIKKSNQHNKLLKEYLNESREFQ